MTEAPKETKKIDQGEIVSITRKQFKEELQKAKEDGSRLKYMVLGNFLFTMCEFYSDLFKPPHMEMEEFLGFTLYTLQEEFKKKYKREEDEEVKESEEAPQAGCKDVPEGSERRQETDQRTKQEA